MVRVYTIKIYSENSHIVVIKLILTISQQIKKRITLQLYQLKIGNLIFLSANILRKKRNMVKKKFLFK